MNCILTNIIIVAPALPGEHIVIFSKSMRWIANWKFQKAQQKQILKNQWPDISWDLES